MPTNRSLETFLDTAIAQGLYSTKGNLRFHLDTLFRGIEFEDKAVLDIGGGSGLLSFYAWVMGAREVLCLEPEADGSTPRIIEAFQGMKERLGAETVALQPVTFQEFQPADRSFDVVTLHNSINHLDEDACTRLLDDPEARETYARLFAKLYEMTNPGGKVLICDCSRYNLFQLLGVKNPFAPMIEWEKHQAPEVWAALLGEAGFVDPRVRWTSFNRWRDWGKRLVGNKVMAYFLTSHFCLTVERP